jgi:hypothetical protein
LNSYDLPSFSDLLAFLNQLQVRKALWQIMQIIKVTQSVPPCLHLTHKMPFSAILRKVCDLSDVYVSDLSVTFLQRGMCTVAFNVSV